MTKIRSMTFALLAVTALLSPTPALGQSRAPEAAVPVPLGLEVPQRHSLFLGAHATGTQNFVCVSTGAGMTWKFTGPQATLFFTFWNDRLSQQIATHFLSANPAENGMPRPTWQHSLDSSAVWAAVVESSTDPGYVEAAAIPWLLLEVKGAQRGPTGGTTLTHARYIHRVNTSGGLAPATGCSQTGDAGAVALVPYEADYLFYKAGR